MATALILEPQGERRRSQLTRAAAHVIETEGIDALRMPRVAEVAGCARSLVYRYFPRREDLLVAVISEFQAQLETRLDPVAQSAGMRALGDPDTARPLLEAIWDTVSELGAGGLILYASPRLGRELNDRVAEVTARLETRWVAPLRDAGLSAIEASLVVKSAAAMQTELLERSRRQEITREEAIDLGQRALAGLVEAFRTKGES